MYVQTPEQGGRQAPPTDVILPKNYSGNAFRQYTESGNAEPQAPPDPLSPILPPEPPNETPAAAIEQEAEAAPVWNSIDGDRDRRGCDAAHHHTKDQDKRDGFFSRFPFLSSLLPPPRGKHKKDGILPEWVVIAAVILLFFSEDGESDILPFLLLLLLWD